jgi:hypothetical protein
MIRSAFCLLACAAGALSQSQELHRPREVLRKSLENYFGPPFSARIDCLGYCDGKEDWISRQPLTTDHLRVGYCSWRGVTIAGALYTGRTESDLALDHVFYQAGTVGLTIDAQQLEARLDDPHAGRGIAIWPHNAVGYYAVPFALAAIAEDVPLEVVDGGLRATIPLGSAGTAIVDYCLEGKRNGAVQRYVIRGSSGTDNLRLNVEEFALWPEIDREMPHRVSLKQHLGGDTWRRSVFVIKPTEPLIDGATVIDLLSMVPAATIGRETKASRQGCFELARRGVSWILNQASDPAPLSWKVGARIENPNWPKLSNSVLSAAFPIDLRGGYCGQMALAGCALVVGDEGAARRIVEGAQTPIIGGDDFIDLARQHGLSLHVCEAGEEDLGSSLAVVTFRKGSAHAHAQLSAASVTRADGVRLYRYWTPPAELSTTDELSLRRTSAADVVCLLVRSTQARSAAPGVSWIAVAITALVSLGTVGAFLLLRRTRGGGAGSAGVPLLLLTWGLASCSGDPTEAAEGSVTCSMIHVRETPIALAIGPGSARAIEIEIKNDSQVDLLFSVTKDVACSCVTVETPEVPVARGKSGVARLMARGMPGGRKSLISVRVNNPLLQCRPWTIPIAVLSADGAMIEPSVIIGHAPTAEDYQIAGGGKFQFVWHGDGTVVLPKTVSVPRGLAVLFDGVEEMRVTKNDNMIERLVVWDFKLVRSGEIDPREQRLELEGQSGVASSRATARILVMD